MILMRERTRPVHLPHEGVFLIAYERANQASAFIRAGECRKPGLVRRKLKVLRAMLDDPNMSIEDAQRLEWKLAVNPQGAVQ